jgi:molybdopterin converting factor small subunit
LEIKLNNIDVINNIEQMFNEEKKELSKYLCKDEVIMQEVNQHYYDVLTARENIIKKREALLDKYINKFGSLN